MWISGSEHELQLYISQTLQHTVTHAMQDIYSYCLNHLNMKLLKLSQLSVPQFSIVGAHFPFSLQVKEQADCNSRALL